MTEILENLTIRSDPAEDGDTPTDLLSHVLSQIRLTGDRVYLTALKRKGRLRLQSDAAHVCVVTKGALCLEQGARTARD
jgi:hypothetical protein